MAKDLIEIEKMFIKRILLAIKFRIKKVFKSILVLYYKNGLRNSKFCIISNDCWGAELYKLTDREFNTPFIGLMIMGPCYIKMLENLNLYLRLPINFKSKSKYPAMQKIKSGINFPLGILGDTDIEIHFLHYKSETEARAKWERRVSRIDWTSLFIKYDCSKDYADEKLVSRFINMKFNNGLIIGKENFGHKEVIQLENCTSDAVKLFRLCFLKFNPVGWLKGEPNYKNSREKYIGRLTAKYF
jgi:uncharacterized protein (DUF1919 family)